MIESFKDQATEDVFHGNNTSRVRRLRQDILERARRKLDMINAAKQLEDLRAAGGNHLEALSLEWEGWHSIRVNGGWRIWFRWSGNNAFDVWLREHP